MTRLFIAWITLAAMCLLLAFKIDLNSDLLFLDSVMVDLFAHGGAWSNWKITPAPAYFPDMLAYALAYFVFPNPAQRVVFVCVAQTLLLAWACIHLARTIKPSISENAKILILITTTVVVLVSANSSMWLFFNSTNNHFASLVLPLFCLAWALEFLRKKRIRELILVICGVTLGTASTSIFSVAFTAPALIFLIGCIFIFRSHRQLRQSALKIGAAILAGQIIAMLSQRLILSHNALEGRPLFTTEAALKSITAFSSATHVTFGSENLYTLALAVFLVICIVWVFLDWGLNVRLSFGDSSSRSSVAELEVLGKNAAYGVSITFLLVALPVNVIGAVLSGGFGDNWGYRYFAYPIALGALLWIVMLDFRSLFASRRAGMLVSLLMATVAYIGMLSVTPLLLQSNRASYSDAINTGVRNQGEVVGECIDLEARNGFVFGSGIGDFWNASGVSYKTRQHLYILPIDKNAIPVFHMMSLGPLIEPQKYGLKPYNFVVMRKSGSTTQFDLNPETLGRLLPQPARRVSCKNTDSELWLYTDGALDTTVRSKVNQFLGQQGMLVDYQMAARELPGTVGKVQSLSRVAEAGTDAEGYLTYGPYIKVPAGHYQAIISYSSTASGNKWDAGRFDTPKQTAKLAGGDVPTGSGELRFSFKTSKDLSNFEIRTWFGGRGTFTINKIQLQRLASR